MRILENLQNSVLIIKVASMAIFCQEDIYLFLSRFDSDILEAVVELVDLNTFELCTLGIQILTIFRKTYLNWKVRSGRI